ncbi:MAG TPA: HD domain-containing protein [Acidobacteriaceae bacterium]|jgi:3'-5' exoribonuclease|nr:HD domain-containing protein [Acidobacteriaceae bacterium]
MKDFFVADAARFENQSVTSYFCLSMLSLRERKSGDGQYLALTLADKTGQLEARMWEEFAAVLETCAEGCYVKAQGQISKYQGKFQITLTKMRAAAESEVDAADFVPATEFDVAEMMAELRGYVEEFRSAPLRALVLRFLDDPAVGAAFQQAPAAKRLHHAWLGGLLEHVLALVRVCRGVAPFYPEVDRDLLVTGAILHDIGKVRELSWRTSFSYTLEGQLIGHISIAQRMLAETIAGMDAEARESAAAEGGEAALFPEPLRVLVEHMILAHHGKLEFGSPKLPMTPEAMLLSALDDLEAKFQTMRAEFKSAREEGKRAEEMTEWVRSMERPLFDSRRWMEASGVARDEMGEPGEEAGAGSE